MIIIDKMHNYKLTLEYNGTNFSGSQVQNSNPQNPEPRTVQGELDKALSGFFKSSIETCFAGRTDAGVHAIGQVVNFKIANDLSFTTENEKGKLLLSLNSQIPDDMAITNIEKVTEDFHARFSAQAREYMYKIFVRRYKPVLRVDSLAWVKEPLDFELMQKHAQSFLGSQDFSRFAKDDEDPDANYICEVQESELIVESKICIKYRIKANRFLRHMVRRMVGELVQVGKGETPGEETSNLTMPASGLTLVKVHY